MDSADTVAAEVTSDPEVEPLALPAPVVAPENHPLAGVFEDWAWTSIWTAKWLREQQAQRLSEHKRTQRSKRAQKASDEANARAQESQETAASHDSRRRRSVGSSQDVGPRQVRRLPRRRSFDSDWHGRVRREARERRDLLQEEARLLERWAMEEEETIDDEALFAAAFAGGDRVEKPTPTSPYLGGRSPIFGRRHGGRSPLVCPSGDGADVPPMTLDASSSYSSSHGLSSPSASTGLSPGNSPTSGPKTDILPCLDQISRWVSLAELLSSRHDSKKAILKVPPDPEELKEVQPAVASGRPDCVPALILRELSLLRTDDLVEPDQVRHERTYSSDGMSEKSHDSRDGKASHQISDLLHAFVGPEEFRRIDAAASVQQRLLAQLVQVRDDRDLDMEVWNETQRHAVEHILEGGDKHKELACVPVAHMQRLLATRGYELPEPDKAQNLGKGSFGRVIKVRRTSDGQLFAMKRQFLGVFADDMVPVLRETTILNLLKGAWGVVQIEDAFLMRPAKAATEVWSVLEHFPHNLYKVRHRFRTEEAARRVVFQVLLGLNSLHCADIVHRDLKPDNVLVDLGPAPPRTVRVALCDFNTSRSVHGFATEAPATTSALDEVGPRARSLSVRVTTSWWRAPEMWGWADTCQMTKRDLKSLDVFALGLVWAELLAVRSVLRYSEGRDPPKYRLLEILQKVDRPTDADLHELGFSDDVSCFIRCVLSGNLTALKPEMTSDKFPENREAREALLEEEHLGIRNWVKTHAWQLTDPNTTEMIASMARFSYRERPAVETLLHHSFFEDLLAEAPAKANTTITAPSIEDIRETIRLEHDRQHQGARRAKEMRDILSDSQGGTAQDAFFKRMAANTAADVEESVRSVCTRVRKEIKKTQHRGRRRRSSGCQSSCSNW